MAAARTARAVSPQAVKTQVVAALWIASLFSAVHWHARSEMEQVVSLVVAASMQGFPQAGIVLCAAARPEKATIVRVENLIFAIDSIERLLVLKNRDSIKDFEKAIE